MTEAKDWRCVVMVVTRIRSKGEGGNWNPAWADARRRRGDAGEVGGKRVFEDTEEAGEAGRFDGQEKLGKVIDPEEYISPLTSRSKLIQEFRRRFQVISTDFWTRQKSRTSGSSRKESGSIAGVSLIRRIEYGGSAKLSDVVMPGLTLKLEILLAKVRKYSTLGYLTQLEHRNDL
ncbi:ff196c2a-0b5b-4287-be71-2021d1c96c2e-CDS [Sclerotinia trifoliorum]|uniref:Ff196c2a-0b5b-4287-be71-2021d1c96c2e-CDS n=1 Tax=Sclerotinia trifoliorum TaxID=28548 RepID=A0A8H2W346_9HELO|nr:ff196c2a-0b5b-4287-be71-2021d1c96c2e-CDS [Sclerotinia trifoliorum]